jgi:uncharacterized protein YodC (DUF2158 family)
MEFEIGMEVQLKSGSPTMTIQAVDGENITCTWFDKAARKDGVFHAKTIEDADKLPKLLERISKNLKKEE